MGLTRGLGSRKFHTNMTLRQLLEPLGIKTYGELARRIKVAGLSLTPQMCWLLWTGRSLPGRKSAHLISRAVGIPMGVIIEANRDSNGDRSTRDQ